MLGCWEEAAGGGQQHAQWPTLRLPDGPTRHHATAAQLPHPPDARNPDPLRMLCHARRVVVYIMVAALVGGSVYGAARVGRSGGGGGAVAAAGLDEFALSDSLLDNARVGGAALIEGGALGGGSGVGGLHGGLLRQQQQGRGQRARAQAEQHHLHDDVLDRRAALEQQHEAATAAGAGTEGLSAEEAEQQRLEAQHLAELRYLEAQHALAAQHAHGQQQEQRSEEQRKQAGAHGEHEPALTEHIAAHIAAQQALPRREGPSLYSANLSGELSGSCQVRLLILRVSGFLQPGRRRAVVL